MKRASQCVLHTKHNNKYYCVYNSIHKKYAPIGGKGEDGECEITCLLREMKEEVGNLNINKILHLGAHVLTYVGPEHNFRKGSVQVDIFVVEVEHITMPIEDFLVLCEIGDIPKSALTKEGCYTSLLAILQRLENNCHWGWCYEMI